MMTPQQATVESERCLQCFDAPCVAACPTHIDIPKFIGMIRSGNIIGAAEVVKTSNALANTCGKVCPQEMFCQSVCTRGKQDAPIEIRDLHFFATQNESRQGYSKTKKFPKPLTNVGVIGAGPAGLSCAFELTKLGHQVKVYDSGGPGGVPAKSIPPFRLNNSELQADIQFLTQYFPVTKQEMNAASFKKTVQTSDAVFLSVGLGRDRLLGIPGEHLNGVVPALQFLRQAKRSPSRLKVGRSVVIVGGGNVSLDTASTAKRLGAERVILIYRRSEKEMRIWKSELNEARKQGVEIRFLTNPVSIIGSRSVRTVQCRSTRLGRKKDKSGRPIPVEVKGSEFLIEADTVVVAIGQVVEADWLGGIKRTKQGYVSVDKNYRTSNHRVFAGGDVITGEGTVVQSVAHGKQAAHAIHDFLSKKQR
ncbi:MAG: FAD-dependent oxidoreductase [Bacteroidota bacterium]